MNHPVSPLLVPWLHEINSGSKTKFQSQLSDSWVDRGATDDTEGRRVVAVIRISKLWMIEDIEEFGSQLNMPFFWPAQPNNFGNGEVKVCLIWSVHNPGGAISEVGADTIRTDNRGRRETPTFKVTI